MRQIIVDFGVFHLFGLEIPLRIYGYGLMMVLGFLSGIALAQWRARRGGGSPELVPILGILALVGGVVGARLAYVIENWREFAARPWTETINVTSGGLIYYGGVVGATALVLAYLRIKRLPLRRYLDIISVSLMVGLAFGRAGCLLNGCCYGGQCSEHWALHTRFPMFSQPLLKLDSAPGPFSASTDGPSPVFGHQWERRLLQAPAVDERLIHLKTGRPHAPRYLHGALSRDQLDVVLGAPANAHAEFVRLTGGQPLLDYPRWAEGLAAGGPFLRGSEFWDEAAAMSKSRQGALSFAEAWGYFQERKSFLEAKFDEDRNGRLEGPERREADAYLRADLLALAAGQKSLPVRPAQLLAMVNALVIAGILWGFYGLRWREGQVFALLLVLYPLTRIVEEAIRDDNPHNFSQMVFTHNQVESMLIMLVALSIWLLLRRLPPLAGANPCAAKAPPDAPRSPRPQRGRMEKPVSRKGN